MYPESGESQHIHLGKKRQSLKIIYVEKRARDKLGEGTGHRPEGL